ncbi:Ku protein [Streptomyces sp. NPDC087859]|uniref:Ku protein n=1 Tax=Streptomyces sp. NPDC087859 TaxID=3365812 RepID=UPI003816FC0E
MSTAATAKHFVEHAATLGVGRVRVRKVRELEGREVAQSEIGKGYEYARDQVVAISDAELLPLPLPTAKAIEIQAFVPLESIDPIRIAEGYYLVPDEVRDPAAGAGRAVHARHRRRWQTAVAAGSRSSNRAAYSSNGPGVGGHGRRAVIDSPPASKSTGRRLDSSTALPLPRSPAPASRGLHAAGGAGPTQRVRTVAPATLFQPCQRSQRAVQGRALRSGLCPKAVGLRQDGTALTRSKSGYPRPSMERS